jgi:hypothetical protein
MEEWEIGTMGKDDHQGTEGGNEEGKDGFFLLVLSWSQYSIIPIFQLSRFPVG